MAKERLMTMREVAEYFQCSVSTVRRWVARGRVPHYRMGKMIRFRRGELDAWLVAFREGEWPREGANPRAADSGQLSLFPLASN